MKLSALREQRSAKVAAMKNLVDKAGAESRDLSADEIKQFDALKSEERTLGEQIDRAEYLQEVERRAMGEPVSSNACTDFEKLAGGVSVVKVIRAQMEGRSLDGAEAEYAQEAERRSGRKAEGAFVPMRALETRADGVNTTTTAPQIVPTVHRADQYIEPLRERLLARQLGVRVLTGLSGNIVIPKFGSGLTLGWVGENEPVPEGEMTFGNVELSPKHTGGKTEMSRQLIQQSSPGIEQLVRDDLSYLVAKAIDLALINGTGAKQPLGVLNAPGTQTGTLTSADWPSILALPELLELVNANAVNWLTTPQVKTKLAAAEKVPGSGSGFLYQGGQMADLPLAATKQVPADTLILGDWSQVLLGVWSELDILVNPYAEPAYSRGGVQVRAMATVDVAIRHPEGFVIVKNALAGGE
ncbi:TPA: phage major capsid protein [Pseudomonas aeruginosa]|uniref:phage major capsid protein n=1 Tax=Pseudomonas aeruginosa TaxID=287 RepID=UPI001AAF1050|nr:phage major capsid protein [Pseudomonas aeruginosa]EKX9247931.1 phage major capsid protein [Pseudomonas aeruginosa]MBO2857302.1 phage major capsid protein [Pseudomonas aeruginosa]MBO2936685.1 phage major capsid protein [Pseudomonas aeruginosa]MBO8395501.1 phage major capsid protein [Pseudomonas aeruginosa]MCO2635324.1 phage major capsid protein [Pseudomonas aeruginosa]